MAIFLLVLCTLSRTTSLGILMNIFKKIEIMRPNVFHFKAFGIINLHCERRIYQKIYDRITMTVYVKCVVRFKVHKTLLNVMHWISPYDTRSGNYSMHFFCILSAEIIEHICRYFLILENVKKYLGLLLVTLITLLSVSVLLIVLVWNFSKTFY